MKHINPRIIMVAFGVLFSGILGVIVGFSEHSQSIARCKGLLVNVVDQSGNMFVQPEDLSALFSSPKLQVKGKEMQSIEFSRMENTVLSNPYIDRAEVYSTVDGFVKIDAWQRNPLMRVINHDNEHFYVDENGDFMPVSDMYTANVPVVSGFLYDRFTQKNLKFAAPYPNDTLQKPLLVQCNEIALFLKRNPFWDAQTEQIFVNEQDEIELVPRVGNQTILLGNSDDLESKMKRLKLFYTEGASRKGWNTYSVINLKFKGQVVCTRKNPVVQPAIAIEQTGH